MCLKAYIILAEFVKLWGPHFKEYKWWHRNLFSSWLVVEWTLSSNQSCLPSLHYINRKYPNDPDQNLQHRICHSFKWLINKLDWAFQPCWRVFPSQVGPGGQDHGIQCWCWEFFLFFECSQAHPPSLHTFKIADISTGVSQHQK